MLPIQPLGILEEAMDVYQDNLIALSLAMHPFSKHTPQKIFKDLVVSKWQNHEDAIRQAIDTNTMRDVRKYIMLSKVDYAECLNIMHSTSEFLRLNDFQTDGINVKKELANIEKIIDYAKDIHVTLSKLDGKPVKYHHGQQMTLF